MDIADSGQAILTGNSAVSRLFYEKYLGRYPEVGRFFAQTDMTHQAVMLRMALTMVEQYYSHRYEALEEYLRIVGFRHKRREIPPNLYDDWRDCMLDTLQEFHGDDWSDTLKQQWTEAVDLAVNRMLEGYELKEGTY